MIIMKNATIKMSKSTIAIMIIMRVFVVEVGTDVGIMAGFTGI